MLRHLFFTLTLVTVVNCLHISFLPKLWHNMDVLEIKNFKNGFFESEFKVKRVNRTTLVMYGPIAITYNIYNFDVDVKYFYSALGNNQFVLLPYKAPRKPLCYYMDNYILKYIYSDLEKVSDLPKEIKGQSICPLLKKETYTIRGFYVPEDSLPTYFAAGLYKCEFQIYKTNDTVIQQTGVSVVKLY